jgi:hypothetical protein
MKDTQQLWREVNNIFPELAIMTQKSASVNYHDRPLLQLEEGEQIKQNY